MSAPAAAAVTSFVPASQRPSARCSETSFTASAVRRSVELGLPEKDGLAIEEVIGELVK